MTPGKIRQELQNLRIPPVSDAKTITRHPIRVRTFGNFEVFHGEEPVKFHYEKTKEMLAYLIDRKGAMCSTQEIIAVLWEDEPKNSHDSYFRNLKADLLQAMRACGHEDIIIQKRGALGIKVDGISCDYYNYLIDAKQGITARSVYMGEYMAQYSWAEITNSNLLKHFGTA